jgi:hypothetical protein
MHNGAALRSISGLVSHQWLAVHAFDEHRFVNVIRNGPTAVFAVGGCGKAATTDPKPFTARDLDSSNKSVWRRRYKNTNLLFGPQNRHTPTFDTITISCRTFLSANELEKSGATTVFS